MCISKSISFCCVPRQTRKITALAFICIYRSCSFQVARLVYSFLLCRLHILHPLPCTFLYSEPSLLLSSFGLDRSIEERRRFLCVPVMYPPTESDTLYWPTALVSGARYYHLYVIIVLYGHLFASAHT